MYPISRFFLYTLAFGIISCSNQSESPHPTAEKICKCFDDAKEDKKAVASCKQNAEKMLGSSSKENSDAKKIMNDIQSLCKSHVVYLPIPKTPIITPM